MKLPVLPNLPWRERDVSSGDHRLLAEYLRDLIRVLKVTFDELRRVINFNAVECISQDDRPTPQPGQLLVWKDTDASTGSPTHYLVYNDGTDIVTFASEETA